MSHVSIFFKTWKMILFDDHSVVEESAQVEFQSNER